MATHGFDTIRIFLRWEDLQPTPAQRRSGRPRPSIDAADAATEVGVELIVTLLTGHMSGVNWVPLWATGGTDGDRRFRVLRAAHPAGAAGPAQLVLRPRGGRRPGPVGGHGSRALAGHPAVWAWDLGNENSNLHRSRPIGPRRTMAGHG